MINNTRIIWQCEIKKKKETTDFSIYTKKKRQQRSGKFEGTNIFIKKVKQLYPHYIEEQKPCFYAWSLPHSKNTMIPHDNVRKKKL